MRTIDDIYDEVAKGIAECLEPKYVLMSPRDYAIIWNSYHQMMVRIDGKNKVPRDTQMYAGLEIIVSSIMWDVPPLVIETVERELSKQVPFHIN